MIKIVKQIIPIMRNPIPYSIIINLRGIDFLK